MKKTYYYPRTEDVKLLVGTVMFLEQTASGADNNPLNPQSQAPAKQV